MIRPAGAFPEPAARLLSKLRPPPGEPPTLVVGADPELAPGALAGLAAEAGAARLLVIGWLGTHPDARHPLLRHLWALEEAARAAPLPALALRLGPLVGPESPLWRRLRGGAPRGRAELLVMPLAEEDALATLDAARSGRAPWEGCFEVAGPEPATLGELAAWAAAGPPPSGGRDGAWEPPLEILAEQRLIDPEPWLEGFGIAPRPVAERARAWAA